jgi:hypothetical protein
LINLSTKEYRVGDKYKILCSVVNNKKYIIKVLSDNSVIEESSFYDANEANSEFLKCVERYKRF